MSNWITPGILTPGVLLALSVLWVLSGRLVPRRTVEQMRADLTGQIAEWRAAYRTEVERNRVLADQLDEVLNIARKATPVAAGNRDLAGEVA